MQDLYRCLDEYAPLLLQVIAAVWDARLPDGEWRAQVEGLAARMSAREAQQQVVARLSAPAQEALARLLDQPEGVPAHRLTLVYGGLRRLGLARLERERPWLRPESALEELYYAGLLQRAYGTVGGQHGEILFVPDPLRGALLALPHAWPRDAVQVREAPPLTAGDGRALMEDLLTILVRLRQEPARAPKGLVPPGTAPALLAELNLAGRLVGSDQTERLALIWRLLWRLTLIEEQQGRLRPTLRARDWLRLGDAQRQASLLGAWRDDPQWDELRLIPTLQCQETGWQSRPVEARRAVLSVLQRQPAEAWLDVASLLAYLKRGWPDFMRPDGDFDSWYLRDAATGTYLRGFGSWDRVEGAAIRHMLATALRWLGVAELGWLRDDPTPTAFRLTAAGQGLLAAQGARAERAGPRPPTPPATLDDGLHLTIPLENTLYERYQLERFAEWQAQGSEATYLITEDSVWRGYNAEIEVEQMLGFLGRITQTQVPEAAQHTLRAWAARLGRVTIRRLFILQAQDEDTLAHLRRHERIGPLLGHVLSPRSCVIAEKDVETITAELKALGLWPRLRLA
ncbi:MAG: helicase-associated domain-containing protein [Chloroflexota bacterium]